jgi:AmmeMemoRadiSam system protein A
MSIKGIVVSPHPPILIHQIGRGEEQRAVETIKGLHKTAEFVRDVEPEVIVVVTPHGNSFSDGACILDKDHIEGDLSDFGYYDYKLGKNTSAKLMIALKDELLSSDLNYIFMKDSDAIHYRAKIKLDHGAVVPLYFIEKYYSDYEIIHITPGMMDLKDTYRFGMHLGEAIKKSGLSTLILASGDLSHCLKDSGPYSYAEEGPIFDQILVESLKQKRYSDIVTMKSHLYEPAGQCGLRSVIMALGAVDGMETNPMVYSYEGPFGVGYMTAKIEVLDEKDASLWEILANGSYGTTPDITENEDDYIRLARKSMNTWVKTGVQLRWEEYKKGLKDKKFINEVEGKRAGVFVSIHKDGQLRGCIGTISPVTQNTAKEIIRNAVEACSFDPRFPAVEPRELREIEVKVDILTEPEKVSSKEMLDPKNYGVIVKSGYRKGLLLPDLDGVDTVEEQIEIAMHKAGIQAYEDYEIYRFKVIRHQAKK